MFVSREGESRINMVSVSVSGFFLVPHVKREDGFRTQTLSDGC